MTDWNAILENLRRAKEASHRFQEAGRALEVNHSLEEIEVFAERMRELQKELEALQKLFSGGSQTVSDEIAEAFSQVFFGHPAPYRSTPKPPFKKR